MDAYLPAGPILELHGQRRRVEIPYGLKDLLSDITTKVLMEQPANLYEFIADFLESKSPAVKQEKEGQEPVNAVETVERQGSITLEMKMYLQERKISRENADDAAKTITTFFRGIVAKKRAKSTLEHKREERVEESLTKLTDETSLPIHSV